MSKQDNIPLPNLPLSYKLFSSLLLVAGMALFAGTWTLILHAVYEEAGKEPLGVQLGLLALENTPSFVKLLALHLAGMIILLGMSYQLFKMTSLRRRLKAALVWLALILSIVDLAAWLYSPSCSATNLVVGQMGALSAVPILILALVPLYQIWIYRRWKNSAGKPVRIVIVGGGFAGTYVALDLNKALGYHRDLEIILVDANNYFLFPPLLPSAAVGAIELREVSYPFRRLLETTNVNFQRLEVQSIDPQKKLLSGVIKRKAEFDGDGGDQVGTKLTYDYLVLAPGSRANTFNTKGAEEHAFFMRRLEDAFALRNHIIDCFETAATIDSVSERKKLLKFVIIGGGPTGVETSTEIYDLIHQVLMKRYPEVDSSIPSVVIVQSGDQILPGWPDDIVRMTSRQLEKMKLEVVLGNRVLEVGSDFVQVGDDIRIECQTAVWCAGVKPARLIEKCGLPLHKSGRVQVADDLQVPEFENIFVLGDAAFLIDRKTGYPLPPLGQVAFQQGTQTAKNIVRLLSGHKTSPFSYFDYGGLVSAGENYAAVNLMGIKFSGFVGWFIWRTLYLVKLPGMSNRIRVMIDWALDLLIERSITQIEHTEKCQSS